MHEAPITEQAARQALRQVTDPEIGLNIIDLGLVYDIAVDGGDVEVRMTLTSPGCPVGPQILDDVQRTLKLLNGVESVNVELVWEPYWSPERIDPKVRAVLGL